MNTARLQTLADGVFAIVMTLLVFEMRIPELADQLGEDIFQLAPNLLSYVLSFIILGVYWVGHHSQFEYIQRADQTLLWLNILFLMCVSLVPFSAGVLGRYGGQQIAVVVYGANLILVSLSHYAMWWYATRGRKLVDEALPPEIVNLGARLSLLPPVIYGIAIALSFFSTGLSIALYMLIPALFVTGWVYRAR